jgi:putative tryptophan/tyrosine transport system substrate-binding protein
MLSFGWPGSAPPDSEHFRSAPRTSRPAYIRLNVGQPERDSRYLQLGGGFDLRRRKFISLLGGAAAWPLAALAQQSAMPVVGFLNVASPNLYATRLRAFHQGLGEMGYMEGRNVGVEYRWAEGQYTRLPAFAADLIRQQVSAIFVTGVPATAAAKTATTTIPIVFEMGADPVAFGLVASLNRPGGNLTGVVSLGVGLGPKQLELLHELSPTATVMALLVNPNNPSGETVTKELQAAARTLGLQLHVFHVSSEQDLDAVFAKLGQLGARGLIIPNEGLFINRSERLAALAIRHAIPAIMVSREFVSAGGLMSYGSSISDAVRLAGAYTGRILRGEKPADLPVQQSTKVELIINLKTAKSLGLTVPLPLLGRANEVIE